MNNKVNLLFLTTAGFLCSCTVTRVNSKTLTLPTKSFVKILHTTKIISCKDKNKSDCPIGTFGHSGSGMAIDIVQGKMTVLTAGHVCDTQPNEAIAESIQLTHVVDYAGNRHQAWPIYVSFHNGLGRGDLCLLWVPTLNVKKIPIASKGANIGDEVLYIGSPMGIHHPPTVPIFKGIYSGKVDASSGMVTFPAIGGSSGAAVLNSNNEIIGVVYAANREFHHVSLIVDYKSLIVFLVEAKKALNSNF